jgi:autotransporter-associated beta strand protein
VGSILALLAPSVSANTLYTENFIGGVDGANMGSNTTFLSTGWTGGGAVVNAWGGLRGGAFSGDGDGWYATKFTEQSGFKDISSRNGEFTLLNADRIETQFKADWAASHNNGMRFTAVVNGVQYATDLFGTTAATRGEMIVGNGVVQRWVLDQTIDLETANWYQTTNFGPQAFVPAPFVGLPTGSISNFGVAWAVASNGDQQATDNFRIINVATTGRHVWDGGTANFGAANWTFGGGAGQAPGTATPMIINTAGSIATVAADFTSASSVDLGQTAASTLNIDGGITLGATKKVTVGASGTLNVNGTLTAPAIASAGNLALSTTGTINATHLQITGGSVTTAGTGALNLTGATSSLRLDGGTLTHNSTTALTPAIVVFNGGTLAGTGTVTPTNRYEVHTQTFHQTFSGLNGTGTGLTVMPGTTILAGTNTYTGTTEIRGDSATAILRLANASDLSAGNLFFNSQGRFQQDSRNRPAILETQGTLARNIGTGVGQIQFVTPTGEKSSASFAAFGGPLTVTLNGGGNLDWANTSTGLKNIHLQFGSPNANNVVTLTNGLNMAGGDRSIFALDNPGSLNDYVVIQGPIVGTNTFDRRGGGRMVLEGVNTHTGNINVNGEGASATFPGMLEIGAAGQLNSGNYAGNIIINANTIFRYNSTAAQTLTGVISQSGTLIKDNAASTLTIGPGGSANTYTGAVIVNGGTLSLEKHSTGAAPYTVNAGGILRVVATHSGNSAYTANAGGILRLDYTADNSKINDGASLTLAGGTVDLNLGTHLEVVGSTTLNPGASSLTQTGGTSTLRMNNITRNAGGVINFAAASIADTDKTNTNGILGPWATLNNTDWAINSTNAGDGAVTAILPAGYTDIDATASVIADASANNVRLNAAGGGGNITLGAGTTTINTLLQGTGTAATVDTVAGNLRTGGIMIASGQESVTIGAAVGDGTLSHNTTSGTNNEVVLINNNAAKTLTINAVIANNGTTGLATAGAGPIVLAAANTFTGTTNASGSELRLANALALQSSTLNTVASNTVTFAAGVTAATLGGLSGSGGFALQDTAAAAVALTVGNNNVTTTFLGALSGSGGSLTKIGSGTLTLSGNLSYTGGTSVSAGTLILAGNNVAATGDITVATGASIQFNFMESISGTGRNVKPANSATTRVIAGYPIDNGFLNRLEESSNGFTIMMNSASGNSLDLNTSTGANLPNASLATTTGVTYTGIITPNASTYRFGGGTAALTLNTPLADSGGVTSLVKTGSDILILQRDNTYTGTTTIASGGTLQVGANTVTGTLGSGDVTNNGTLNFRRGFNFAIPSLTVPNNIGGTGSLVKDNGNGTIILSGTNTYSGTTAVSAGALQYNSTASVAIGGGATTRDITVNTSGTLVFGPAFGDANIPTTLVNKVVASSAGAIAADNYAATNFDFQAAGLTAASLGAVGNVNYTGTLTQQGTTYRLGGGGGTLTMANTNAITGANTLQVNSGLGGTTVVLPVANDYTGTTTINSGAALRISDASALGTIAGGTTVNGGGALELSGGITVVDETLSLNGTGVSNAFTGLNTSGALRNISGSNTWGALITLAGGTRIQADSGTLTIDVAAGNAITGTQPLTFAGNGNFVVADPINIGNQTLTKEAGGRLELTGTNTYTGTTIIHNGTLFAVDGTGLPTASVVQFNGNGVGSGLDKTFDGGVLESNGTIARTIGTAAGNINWSQGHGGFAAKGGSLDVTLNADAVIDWNVAGGFNQRVLVLNSATADNVVTMKNPINMNGSRTITVLDNPNTTADYAHLDDILSGANLTKLGAGRLLLSAANTYNGTTTISVGTLAVGANAPGVAGAGALGNSTSEVVLGGAGYANDAGLIITGGAFTVGRNIRIPTLDVTDPGTRVITIGGDTAHSSVFSGNIFLGSSNNAGKGVTLTAASGGTVTFSGVIQNPTGQSAPELAAAGTMTAVTKSGAGTVIFSNASMVTTGYTGLTLVADGTLQLGVNNGIRSGNAVTVAPTGASSVLDLAAFNQTIGGAGLTLGGALTTSAASVIGTGTLTLSGGATAVTYNAANNPLGATIAATTISLADAPQTFNVGDSTTVTGVGNEVTISSAITAVGANSALVKTGTGSLKLDGAQGYDILTVDDGTANVNGILGTAPGLAVVTVNDAGNGTKLRFGTVSQTLSSLTIGAGATVVFTSGAASGSFGGGDKGAGFGSLGGGATVPEPGTLGLLLVGALGMLNRRRRQA